MISLLLFALFFVLFASRALGFDLSLAPGLSVKNAFLYLIFGALAIDAVVTRRHKPELLSVLGPFFAYAAYATFTWLVALLIIQYPGYQLRETAIGLKSGPIEHLLVLLIFFFGTSDAKRGLSLLRAIVWLVIVGNLASVLHVLHILNLGLIGLGEDDRLAGPNGLGNPNQYGAFLVLFLPAMVALYFTERRWKRFLAGCGVLVSALALLMTASRGAVVGLAVAGILGAWYLRATIPLYVTIRAAFGVALLSVVALGATLLTDYGRLVLDRFSDLDQAARFASSGRTVIWGTALKSMMEHPITFLTGYGWDAYEEDAKFHFVTHNYYLNILYNLGAIGLTLFLAVAANALGTVRAAVARAEPEARAFLTAFVFGFLALLGSLFFGELYTSWLYVWGFAGISLRLAVSQRQSPARTVPAAAVSTSVVAPRKARFPALEAQRANRVTGNAGKGS